MRALRLREWKSEPELVEVPDPTPGPGQVVVRIGGAGACHSDLHLMDEFEPGTMPWNPPFTLGHENAGWVHALGDGVTGLSVGQPVAVFGAVGLWHLRPLPARASTRTARTRPLRRYRAEAAGSDWTAAWPSSSWSRTPGTSCPFRRAWIRCDAAPLTDAGLTPYHAIRRSWPKLPPGSTAVVIGVGGLGHVGVQILKATTAARVIAVDTRAEALRLAEECGADRTVISGSDRRRGDPGRHRRSGRRRGAGLRRHGRHPGARRGDGPHRGRPDHRGDRRRHRGGVVLLRAVRGEYRDHLLGQVHRSPRWSGRPRCGPPPAERQGAVGADEVEHHVGAAAAGGLADLLGGVGPDAGRGRRRTRSASRSASSRVSTAIDARGGQCLEDLHRHVAQPADADHDGGAARAQLGQERRIGVVRREPGVGQRRGVAPGPARPEAGRACRAAGTSMYSAIPPSRPSPPPPRAPARGRVLAVGLQPAPAARAACRSPTAP